ncbi:uncharacterized protein BHQ10_001652 [Talaromyces amestolkiae]|uniref:DUF7905 domain-containing protein n=1 Tax=Talaromyces amestolkiae TaxID=1196081 RepID=A0A364KQ01_TALAM|nr:uncharacterized protein BHQ10_001652 [Talaromyces amestolkiae]RAO65640.1 hypothetical protein BHQ10_001652 [Talaromyces amestolkiae]
MATRNRQAPKLQKQAFPNVTRNPDFGYGGAQSAKYTANSGISDRRNSTKLYLLGLPCPGRFVKSILLDIQPEDKQKTKKAKVNFVTTEIRFTGLLIDKAELWSTNINRLLAAFEESFRCVPSLKGVAQMRVTLGSFSFEQYRYPKNPQNGYSFDEFNEMLSQPMTRGRITSGLSLDQLLNQIRQANEMFVLENDQSAISTARRSVKVEFPPKDNELIHLEVDFRASEGHYEKVNSRWVRSDLGRSTAGNRPLLQAVMLNPERADLEFKIQEKTILDPGQLDQSMRDILEGIRFRPSENDTVDFSFLAPAKRHSKLPIGAKIFRLVEKATVQYQVRNTDYFLEIARYDIYYPKPSRARQAADSTSYLEFNPPTSFSEVVLYGQSWDNATKAFGRIQGTESFDLNSALYALFKPEGRETPRDAFERFILIATNVAGLWNPAGSRPMESIPRPSSTSRTTKMSVNEGFLIDLD